MIKDQQLRRWIKRYLYILLFIYVLIFIIEVILSNQDVPILQRLINLWISFLIMTVTTIIFCAIGWFLHGNKSNKDNSNRSNGEKS